MKMQGWFWSQHLGFPLLGSSIITAVAGAEAGNDVLLPFNLESPL